MKAPWLGYVPVPGLQAVPVLLAPGDRLSRFHAWQSAVLVVAWLLGLALLGFLRDGLQGGARGAVDLVAGVWGLAGIAFLAIGLWSAARGRFKRLPGVAAVLTVLGR